MMADAAKEFKLTFFLFKDSEIRRKENMRAALCTEVENPLIIAKAQMRIKSRIVWISLKRSILNNLKSWANNRYMIPKWSPETAKTCMNPVLAKDDLKSDTKDDLSPRRMAFKKSNSASPISVFSTLRIVASLILWAYLLTDCLESILSHLFCHNNHHGRYAAKQ